MPLKTLGKLRGATRCRRGLAAVEFAFAAPALPQGFTVVAGDSIIVAEVIYDYVPWPVQGVTTPSKLYHRALFRPRFGALRALDP